MRGLWGASGVAVLVPGGIIAAMVLLALSGSFGRIAGLGQAFSGPAPPNVTAGPSSAGIGGKQGSTLLAALAVPATAAPVAVARPGITGGRSVTNTRPGAPTGRPPGSRGPGTPQQPTVPSPPTGGQGCVSGCAPPAPKPTLVDRVVALGTSVTSKIPGPVGQLATQILTQVGATVDQVLPHNVRRTAQAVTQLGTTVTQLKLP